MDIDSDDHPSTTALVDASAAPPLMTSAHPDSETMTPTLLVDDERSYGASHPLAHWRQRNTVAIGIFWVLAMVNLQLLIVAIPTGQQHTQSKKLDSPL